MPDSEQALVNKSIYETLIAVKEEISAISSPYMAWICVRDMRLPSLLLYFKGLEENCQHTLVSRANPNLPCTSLLADEEWKVLYAKINHTKHYPETPPTIRDAVRWVAQLGGFLARKNDGEPGPITLWRG